VEKPVSKNPFDRLGGEQLRDNLTDIIYDLTDAAGHNALWQAINALKGAETAAERAKLVEAAQTAASHSHAATIAIAIETTIHVLGQLAAPIPATEPEPDDAA
jgi:hypothetical protein